MEPKNGMFVGGRERRRGLDEKTERKEELQWARIRVRINGGKIPKMVEICVENLCYPLCATRGQAREEVGGRLEARGAVAEVDGTRKLTHGSGRSTECSRGLGALQLRPKGKGIMQSGPTEMGFVVEPSGSEGLSPSSSFVDGLRRLREAESFHTEQTKTDLALIEEAKRYVQPDCLISEPPLSPSFLFGRTPVGEFCDLSGPRRSVMRMKIRSK
ncbi:hypothetical protein CK203_076003 [Vitis vinifera]|uniref:Uncharacterized protein n=1 Tax=Vitis vinifera TaxID=29760 RepID=A0A438C1G8_VITVI|nr:hypothetical protein CK203_076003 [Vitis vinifera]